MKIIPAAIKKNFQKDRLFASDINDESNSLHLSVVTMWSNSITAL